MTKLVKRRDTNGIKYIFLAAFFTAFLAGTDALQSASLGNPLILTALSGIAGSVLGLVALNVSASLGK